MDSLEEFLLYGTNSFQTLLAIKGQINQFINNRIKGILDADEVRLENDRLQKNLIDFIDRIELEDTQIHSNQSELYESAKLAFSLLNFDKDQFGKFGFTYKSSRSKHFSFLIHGKTKLYGQRWLYNKILRTHKLDSPKPITYSFDSVANEGTKENCIKTIALKLGYKKREARDLRKDNGITEAELVECFLKCLNQKNLVITIKSSHIGPIRNLIIPLCKNLLKEISKKSTKYSLIFFVCLYKELKSIDRSDFSVWNQPLVPIDHIVFQNWFEDCNSMGFLPIYKFFEVDNLTDSESNLTPEACEKEFGDFINEDLPILSRLRRKKNTNNKVIRKDIPAEIFMQKIILNKMSLDWDKFSTTWMKY